MACGPTGRSRKTTQELDSKRERERETLTGARWQGCFLKLGLSHSRAMVHPFGGGRREGGSGASAQTHEKPPHSVGPFSSSSLLPYRRRGCRSSLGQLDPPFGRRGQGRGRSSSGRSLTALGRALPRGEETSKGRRQSLSQHDRRQSLSCCFISFSKWNNRHDYGKEPSDRIKSGAVLID